MAEEERSSSCEEEESPTQLDENLNESGAFSAINSSMVPGRVRPPDHTFIDEFAFICHRESPVTSRNTMPIADPAHRTRWVAHMEFNHSEDAEDASWDKLDYTLERGPKLATLMQTGGIPHELRVSVWPRLCSALEKKKSCEYSYTDLVRLSASDTTLVARQIERDLLRTLPTNVCFQGPHSVGIGRLRRILRALAWLYPNIGYCQGMGAVVAYLLLVVSEEDTFWVMCSLVEDILPGSYYNQQLLGVQADQKVLRLLVGRFLPEVDSLFSEHDIELSLITLQWFLSLYSTCLQTAQLYRVWDELLYSGSVVLFQFALVLMRQYEMALCARDNSHDILNLLAELPGNITNMEDVLAQCRTVMSELTEVELEQLRRRAQAEIMEEHGSLVSPNAVNDLPKQALVRRHLSPKKGWMGGWMPWLGWPENLDDGFEDKNKNIHQTELLHDLREAILAIARHFKVNEKGSTTVLPDYSNAAHKQDVDKFLESATRQRRARALVDFVQSDDDELAFSRHDVLLVLSTRDEHCWIGQLEGKKGWFPAKFVQLLDERGTPYSAAGDDSVSEAITDLVRGVLCPTIKAVLDYGMKRSFVGAPVHPWMFLEEVSNFEASRNFRSVYSRLVLCRTFNLDQDTRVLTPDELLYKYVQGVNMSHNMLKAPYDVKLRSLICCGLNEQLLHLWFESLCSSSELVERWYHPWSFIRSPGWVQIKCELRILAQFSFHLSRDHELPLKDDTYRTFKDSVRDLLIKHHLFSWEL